ncbi:phosphodiester glycosidase family protein [Spirosoma montaniterrae]|uniref:Metallophosphoesterase n=1 Tax=Spirosoma montaniterrae TaxID=1178516 RepID=A0A1P9X2P2_9BACT|nr:phosphodiester glycosidase family protein [Spirosoma montaniterrae]AQG81906.1 hypothetical protein AWR27_22985 [Spirosoma montaniterrae]
MHTELYRRFFRLVYVLWAGLFCGCMAQAQTPLNSTSGSFTLTWKPREDVNVLLPGSIRVFDTYMPLPGTSAPIRAMYAVIRTDDPNLRLRAVGEPRGATFRLETTKQASERNRGIFAVNGGFFSSNESVSLIIRDGESVASNILSLVRNGRTYFPTRGAFGLVNRRPDVAWVYTLPDGQVVQYASPSPINDTQPAPAQPTSTTPTAATAWNPSQAVGGGPVLVQGGQIRLTANEELFNDAAFVDVNPRTAIGYRDDNALIVLVVDGRQRASAGVTLPQLAGMMQALGCREALNLDGGGSSTMLARDEVVNNPTNVDGGDRNNLRANASALVWTEATETPPREVQIYDTDSPNYAETGLWSRLNQSSFYGSTPARGTAPGQGNKAVYRFNGLAAGRYQLAAWWTVNEANAANVPLVLHRMGGRRDTIRVNQNDYETVAKWNVLGYFELAAGDYLELLGQGRGNRVSVDAIRLVTMEKFPALPQRGDVRIAVVSDLNSGLGSATYEWQVDSIMQRIPRIWRPDLVLCGGDMVAGQGPITSTTVIQGMWRGFDRSVMTPFRASKTPFGFTIGNHDGIRSAAFATERNLTKTYWDTTQTNLPFVDRSNFPFYYSFKVRDLFVASWDASSSTITNDNLNWLRTQLATPEARSARMRFVVGHLPLYSVAQERDAPGNILDRADSLRSILETNNVQTYVSGHHHAYYPGKRGKLELLNAGAAGSGPRQWLFLDRAATNTVTIMDVFYANGTTRLRDTTVYTTYEIAYRDPADMPLFDYKVLPRIIYGYNGTYSVRRDILSNQREANARLSALNREVAQPEQAVGNAHASITGNRILIDGDFKNLKGNLLNRPDAVALYAGRNGDAGRLLFPMAVSSPDRRNGTYSFAQDNASDDLVEQLKAGAVFIRIRTEADTTGEIRSQLYEPNNRPPMTTKVANRPERNVFAVRNIEAIFEINWDEATDAEGDAVSYFYQVATDSMFTNVVYQAGTGRVRNLKQTEADWYNLLGNTPAGQSRTFFHRLITSDGRNLTNGPATRITLTKSDAPLDELVEVPAPAYRYAGRLPNAPNGYGATFDRNGNLWYVDFSASGGAVYIERPNGTPLPFSPIIGSALGGNSNNTGIGTDTDGNILLSRNSRLFKLDARTGRIIASWQSPVRSNGSANTLTVPQPSSTGDVYVPSLWGEDFLYVLKQTQISGRDTFQLVRRITLPGRILSRSFAMEPDGRVVYLPNPGSAQVQKFVSTNGVTYTLAEEINSIAAGSSGIRVTNDKKAYFAVRASGVLPATFHFRDEVNKRLWTLPLPDLGNIEARGLGVSPTGDTLIFCGWNSTGTHRYVRNRPNAPAQETQPDSATASADTTSQARSAARQASTETNAEQLITLFPNPVNEVLEVRADGLAIETVIVTDVQGRTMLEPFRPGSGTIRLSVQQLPTGTYLLVLHTATGGISRRFVKQ